MKNKKRMFWIKIWKAVDDDEPYVSREYSLETDDGKVPTKDQLKTFFDQFDAGLTVSEEIDRPSLDLILCEKLKKYFGS